MRSDETSWERGIFLTEKGYLVRLEMKSMKFSEPFRAEFPEGYKFRWIVFNVENTQELVRIDNHHGKPLHLHVDDEKKSKSFSWISLEHTRQFFFQQAYQRFGYFDYE